ncbi:MAG: hypothetical protein ACM34I_10470 [bacterium]
MAENERPLPEPPRTPFGQKKTAEEKNPFLLADRMAMALAEGRLDEFLEQEMPGNEKTRKLARLMMGLTGMAPPEGLFKEDESSSGHVEGGTETAGAIHEKSSAVNPPEDIMQAAHEGNVQELVELLQREVGRETATPEMDPGEARETAPSASAGIEKEIVDQLIAIGADNNLSLDWLVLRALKVYVEAYRKTGRL